MSDFRRIPHFAKLALAWTTPQRRMDMMYAFAGTLVLLAIYLAYQIVNGPIMSRSDSQNYYYWAGLLLDSGFDIAQVDKDSGHPVTMAYYRSFLGIVALVRREFGEGWREALMGINLVGQTGTAFVTLYLVARVVGGRLAMVAATLLMAVAVDDFRWVTWVLADASYGCFATLVLAMALLFLVPENSPEKIVSGLGLLLLIPWTVFYKPQGWGLLPIPLVMGLLAFGLARYRDLRLLSRFLGYLVVVAFGITAITLFLYSFPASDPRSIEWPLLQESIQYETHEQLYDDPILKELGSYFPPPYDPTLVLRIFLTRMAYMFAPYLPDFSLPHRIINFARLSVGGGLAVVALGYLWRGHLPRPAAVLAILSFSVILSMTVLHAVTSLDGDWRYRAPLIPPLTALTVMGLTVTTRKLAELGLRRAAMGTH